MRTEKEMFDLILGVAKNDDRIRAVYMNGSRTNPNVQKDIFQDYDIVYVVNETESFIKDKIWIDVFGERLIMQKPDELDKIVGNETHFESCYGYLIQFKDGSRIDLHIETLNLVLEELTTDKLTIVLLDKDNALPNIPTPSDEDYWVQKPTQDQFNRCNNEFWWVLNNVAKGLWRAEVPYVMDNLNFWIRPQLVQVLSWYVGILTHYSCSAGKCGKYLNKYLPEDIWNRFLQTYPGADITSIWKAVFIMCELYDEVAGIVSKKCNFEYNEVEANNSYSYLKHVEQLPKDALEVY